MFAEHEALSVPNVARLFSDEELGLSFRVI